MIDLGVVKRTLVYTASGSLSALVAFFMLPILTRYLTPYDYGIVETFTSLTTCLSGVVIIGGNAILAKEYFDYDEHGRRVLIGQILTVTCLSSVLLTMVTAVIDLPTRAIAQFLKVGDGLVYLAILVSLANAIIALLTCLLQVEKRAGHYLAFVNSKTVTEILVSLTLIITVGLKWQGRVAGIAVSSLLYALLALILFRKRGVQPTLAVAPAKHLLVLGLPLVAAHVSVWVYAMVDRVLINNLFDVQSTGLYSVGFRFATVVAMVETAFSMAWMPYFYESVRLKDPKTDREVVKLSFLYAVALLIFALGFGFATQWLLPFMVAPQFTGARRFTFLLCIAFWLSGIWKLFTGYLIVESKTKLYAYITSGAAVFHIILTIFLLRTIGLIGAAWATLVTFGLATLLTIVASLKVHPMPWACIFRSRKNAVYAN